MDKKNYVKEFANTLKDAGNKAFMTKDFDEAVKQYSAAIEMANGNQECPNHVYYSNRANAYLEL